MALTTKQLDDLIQIAKDQIRIRVKGADVSDGGHYDLLSRAVSTVYHGLQSLALYLAEQILPSTAEKAFLELHAAIRGLARLVATKAVGKVLLTMDESPASNANTTQGAGSTITAADGRTYTTDANATSVIGSWSGKTVAPGSTPERLIIAPDVSSMSANQAIDVGGYTRCIKEVITEVNAIDLYQPLPILPLDGYAVTPRRAALASITASAAAAAGNKPVGEQMTLSSPAGASPNDFQPTVVVQELSGGGDLEGDADLRDRVRAFMANRPGGGNVEDYRSWCRDSAKTGVRLADAFVYPGYRGLGTVDVVLLGLTGARFVGASAVTKVKNYVAPPPAGVGGVAPFGDDVLVKGITYKGTPTAVHVQVLPRTGYEPDWSGTATVANSPAPTTTRLYTTLSQVGIIEPGDRVLVPITVAGRARVEQRKVTVVNASFIDIESLTAAPAGLAVIRPGGPLVDAIVAALTALFDGLGPGITSGSTTYTRHPDPGVAWNHKIRPAHIVDTLMSVEGIANVVVVTPGAAGDDPAPQEVLQLGAVTVEHVTS